MSSKKNISGREIEQNLKRVERGRELTRPLRELNTKCNFRIKYYKRFKALEADKIREERRPMLKEYSKKYYQEHMQKISDQKKKYYQKNKKKIIQRVLRNRKNEKNNLLRKK